MRIAVASILKHSRRRLLMQSDGLLLGSADSALKRASERSASTSTSSKIRRVDFDSPPSFSRDSRFQRSNSPRPAFGMASSSSPSFRQTQQKRQKQKGKISTPILPGPLHDAPFVETYIPRPGFKVKDPKHSVSNAQLTTRIMFTYGHIEDEQNGRYSEPMYRCTVIVNVDPQVVGVGDGPSRKAAEELAYRSAAYQLYDKGFLFQDITSATLADGTALDMEKAKSFMEFYCRRFSFPPPNIESQAVPGGWESKMTVGGKRIGLGTGVTKKGALVQCYLDVVKYLHECDPELWTLYREKQKSGDIGYTPSLYFVVSQRLNDEIRDLCVDVKKSNLYRNRPALGSSMDAQQNISVGHFSDRNRYLSPAAMTAKSEDLLQRRQNYLQDPRLATMRETRISLPVFTRSDELLEMIRDNDVVICMAATGSGKTTQIPQIILDAAIEKGEGATCNVLCTQPRRLAALSVAARVAKERGENLGKSVGYQVRFENTFAEDHGSITFCTTGVFLKKLQTALAQVGPGPLDHITHVVVDEVHERDVDTDLLLVVLKRLLAQRRAQNRPLKVILMSATIDPALFQNYFPDELGQPAKVIDIPGRSFPVTKYFLEEFIQEIRESPMGWVLNDQTVTKYVDRELGRVTSVTEEEADLPFPLIAATISLVLQKSDSGHVLVFLPGWDDIVNVQKLLHNAPGSWGLNFADTSKYAIHLLHSTIPLAEQQVIFDPPPEGVRRIILATNIAETSVTIPDVVYVVDTARLKEQRYDPERRIMSLVSAWVGASNLNQRAGRAGRHRSGDYYGILSRKHAEELNPYQTVEMSRVDLTNVVMHVKALNFPGMAIQEVLASTIEPPATDRVTAAMDELQMVGALDAHQNLTSLGRVLLQLPVDVQVGRLVLYGSFFRCLDQALTLAAILSNRDPFVSPMHLRAESREKKNSWSPEQFRSDALATLNAYNAWDELQQRREYNAAHRFCIDNFLAKPSLLMIEKIKKHILQSLYTAGVLQVSAGGGLVNNGMHARQLTVPPEMNVNGKSLPLLAALIASASQPKFAIRATEKGLRTQQEKMCFMHPSGVNNRKAENSLTTGEENSSVKQIYAFAEKRRNISVASHGNAQTFLVTTTRLDPLNFLLFGAHTIQRTETGLKADGWIPIVGHIDGLEDIHHLRELMDACMLRVYEGIILSRRRQGRTPIAREERSETWDDDDNNTDYSLSQDEVKELDLLSRDIVNILNKYNDERTAALSRPSSRPATPYNPFSTRRPSSSQVTPYASRAPTPLSRRRY
ncbi:P-loop containing nucleoside triphosphate hydrolase protein [Mycena floridula]|nr:P-loop containing nucleoside triphosphate hydrolase protein [Mycena floridula]